MKRLMHNGILVLLLTILMVLCSAGPGIAAQGDPAPAAAVQATAEQGTSGVTDLPETGRGHGMEARGTENVALHQMLTTVLVLMVAAVMALGGLALLWRYERR